MVGPSKSNVLRIVLVHGAWHGPWCWERLIPELRLRGFDIDAVDLPSHGEDVSSLGDLYRDAAEVRRVLELSAQPTVLVGHSYGAAVITEAGHGAPNVQHLVYLSAFMPDTGRSVSDVVPQVMSDPESGLSPAIRLHSGYSTIDQRLAVRAFYADVEPELAQRAAARLQPQFDRGGPEPITMAAWHAIPSTYVVAAHDRAIPATLQAEFAKQASRSISLQTSHSAFLSRPTDVAEIIGASMTGLLDG